MSTSCSPQQLRAVRQTKGDAGIKIRQIHVNTHVFDTWSHLVLSMETSWFNVQIKSKKKKKYRYGIVKCNIAIFQCIDIYRFSYLPDLGAMLTWLTSCSPGGRAVAHIPQLWVIGPRGAVLMTTPGRGRRLFTALIRKGQAAAVGPRPRVTTGS